jgi:hypothetical protein
MQDSKTILGSDIERTVDFQVNYERVGEHRVGKVNWVHFNLHTPERVAEFNELLKRAMNCMDKPPEWAVDYMDMVTNTPAPLKPPKKPPEPMGMFPEEQDPLTQLQVAAVVPEEDGKEKA